MNEEIKPISQLINATFSNIHIEDVENANETFSAWKKTVCSIKSLNPNEGNNLYDHSRIVDMKNGIVMVEADHPGWIQKLQFYKDYIVRGLKQQLPQMEIRNIVFKLSGSSFMFDHSRNDEKSKERAFKKLEKNLEEQSQITQKFMKNEQNSAKKRELPPELAQMFDNLRKNMLTKNEN